MKLYAKVIAILALPLIFVVAYALCPIQIPPPGWTLSKLHISVPPQNESPIRETHKEQAKDSCITAEVTDSCPTRILFLGDSMAEGLARRMADYAEENEYELACVIWYNSTTKIWASSDTLQYFMRKYQPTFIMICIGGNEQFLKDPTRREEYIHKIIGSFANTPFIWIGVPAWNKDTGINNLIKECVGGSRFFDTKKLTLRRGSDRIHPTFAASSMWMDSIASWMQNANVQNPITMKKPVSKATRKYPLHLLQPVKE